MEDYLAAVGKKDDTAPFFTFREGNALTKNMFNRLLRGVLKDVEDYADLGNHSFRYIKLCFNNPICLSQEGNSQPNGKMWI